MGILSRWPWVASLVAFALPMLLALGGIARPRRAERVTSAALGAALLATIGYAFLPPSSLTSPGVQLDAVTFTMLLLVAGLGAIVARYSRAYLAGEPGLPRYQRWLLLTLSAVTALVLADNLLIIVLAWTATSFTLHRLLTFYGDRPAALVAAHKKFLVSRLADLCLLGALALVHRDVRSLDLEKISAWANAHPDLTPSMHAAAVLVVLAVALRSAQLPFHGWLTQVMEAPTPVSALLHAGVVNIGGFVLIRLSAWMAHADIARLLLLLIGLASAIVAALVMTTRISVKVALAWSTCAQLGFMLVQCGLGLWPLALLHLVAHSLYKAHAFLDAGAAVHEWRLRALAPRPSPSSSWARVALGLVAAVGTGVLCFAVLRHFDPASRADARAARVLAVFVAVSVLPLLASWQGTIAATVSVAVRVFGVVLLYGSGHAVAARLTPAHEAVSNVGWVLACLGFAALFLLKATVQASPDGSVARALHPWLYAGLYLDERFTRLAFRVWPPRLQPDVELPPTLPSEARA